MHRSFSCVAGACVVGALLLCNPASATILVDPDSTGGDYVYPYDIATPPPLVSSRPLIAIGYGGPGAVEVNSSPYYPNPYTLLWSSGTIQVGSSTRTYPSGNPGYLRIIGDGSWQSAGAEAADYISVGIGGDGLMEIFNGGYASAANIQIGSTLYDADVLVDGPNSYLEAYGGGIGFGGEGAGRTRSLKVSNGGMIKAWDDDYTDGNAEGDIHIGIDDTLTITDSGSQADFELNVFSRGVIEVNNRGMLTQFNPYPVSDPANFNAIRIGNVNNSASMTVSGWDSVVDVAYNVQIGAIDNDFVQDSNGNLQLIDLPAGGAVVIENDATLFTRGDVLVSQAGTTGTLTVRSGGMVYANSVVVQQGGVLNGSGGAIDAAVIVDGGTLAPGNSPGDMTIYGDLQMVSGVLDLEIGGAAFGEYDLLDVWGNVDLGADVTINLNFINGFAPQQYDVFTLLGADTVSGLDLVTLNITGLETGFNYQISPSGYDLTLSALNDGVATTSPVPIPTAVWLFGSGLVGLIIVGRRQTKDLIAPA